MAEAQLSNAEIQSVYTHSKVSDQVYGGKRSKTVWKIVEDDKYRENPFMYFIVGKSYKCCALIDTGCGSGNIREYLHENFKEEMFGKELIVINTHNHYDHVGGNGDFSTKYGKLSPGCKNLCAGNADKFYTMNPHENLGDLVGCHVKPYGVTRWLEDGDVIELGDDLEGRLYVIKTPGHTPDSISLYYPGDRRLFVGDFIYRWAAVLAITEKSDAKQYEQSTRVLLNFIRNLPEKDEIKLSCGHIDENLAWYPTLEKFYKLLYDINRGVIKGDDAPSGYRGRIYETKDCSLSFLIGRVIGGNFHKNH